MRKIIKTTVVLLTMLSIAAFAQEKGSFTDPRDKKPYKTVVIGTQTWMAENLSFAAKDSKCYGEDGEAADKYSKEDENGLVSPISTAKLALSEIQANCQKYGRFYNWETAKKVCPFGWHLPSDAEWDKLGGEEAGKYLKAKSGWNNYKNKSGNGEDIFGFSALPGGYGYYSGGGGGLIIARSRAEAEAQAKAQAQAAAVAGIKFYNAGYSGFWWSATENNPYSALYRTMGRSHADVRRDDNNKNEYLLSVRCLQDN